MDDAVDDGKHNTQETTQGAANGDSVEAAGDAVFDDLTSRLMTAEQQVEEHRAGVLRLQAEMENLRKRSAREIENAHKYGLDRFVLELLPVKDSMELGVAAANGEDVDLTAMREGMVLTLKMFATAMEKFGVEEVAPVQGDRFDHERHQAISVQEDKEKESGAVLVSVQKGCLLNGRLIRPAMVIVNK
ncbi:MAG: nucleotide exchange factor GrpE [Gammaproteobacteria bacterium]|nr:nucleotide exchange factor GrpE [Gammaproteobacteria bacterium]